MASIYDRLLDNPALATLEPTLSPENQLRRTLPKIPESLLRDPVNVSANSETTNTPSNAVKRTPLEWIRALNAPRGLTIPGTASSSTTPSPTATSTNTPAAKKPFDWEIGAGFPPTEQEMTAGGQGYIRDSTGAMALSNETDKQGHRVAYESNPEALGQSRKIPADQMAFAGEVRGPVEQRDFTIIPTQEASPEAMAKSEELRQQSDVAQEASNRIALKRQMALADLAAHQKEHETFRSKWGISAPDLDTPGQHSSLNLSPGRARNRAETAAWIERQDEKFVGERRQLQEQAMQLDQHYGMTNRARDRYLQESQSVIELDRANQQAAYEKQLAHTAAVQREKAEQLRKEALQASEARRKELKGDIRYANSEAQEAEREAATLERRRAAEQRRDFNEMESATRELKTLYEKQLKDFEKELEDKGQGSWSPVSGVAPDLTNAMYKGKKAQFDQDMENWEKYRILKKKALETATEHEQLLLAKKEKAVVGVPSGQNEQEEPKQDATRERLQKWIAAFAEKTGKSPTTEHISRMKQNIRQAMEVYANQ